MADPLFKVGVLGATGYIGAPYRAEIRECGEASIVALCARREELLAKAAEEEAKAAKQLVSSLVLHALGALLQDEAGDAAVRHRPSAW